jgi:hypothetical protein
VLLIVAITESVQEHLVAMRPTDVLRRAGILAGDAGR